VKSDRALVQLVRWQRQPRILKGNTMLLLRSFSAFVLVASSFSTFQTASAQGAASQPVRIVTPNPPGSAGDHLSRGIAEVLGKATGQTYIVENKLGASGTIAAQICAQAPADGKTLCVLDAFNTALAPAIFSNMPYDSKTDLVPVILLGYFPAGIWANKNVPANTMDELLALAKKEPGKLNFATFGAASSSSMYVSWLKRERGVQFTGVNYKSALDAFRAIVTGEADVGSYAMGPAMANSKPGEVKLIAVNNPVRVPSAPDAPTLEELKVKGVLAWFALFAPKGTPPEVVERINAELAKNYVAQPDMRKRFFDVAGIVSSEPSGASTTVFGKFFDDQLKVYADYVKEAGIEKFER
jgi:tripartite-type tricarboxylate transporter receptor subunit TctC